MGKACEVVEAVIKNVEYNKKLGLKVSKNREWKQFNFLVGENGAGKSRFLKLIKDNAQKECNIIHMDFASLNGILQSETIGEESNELAKAIIFKEDLEKNILDAFAENISNQVLNIFNELLTMMGAHSIIKQKAEEIMGKLNPSINKMMNREIKIEGDKIYLQKGSSMIEINSEWKVMSPGERTILVIIVAVLVITMMNKPCILLIDEMETHLHPLVQMDALKLLKNGLEGHDHCTCIASHSVFFLPAFSIEEVVYINNGEIQKINGSMYQQIYNNLVGEDEKESLSDFLKSVAFWQYADYLAECFLKPTTVDVASNKDIQACQLKKILSSLYQERDIINVLDFGAGSARIAKCIELMLRDKDDEMLAEICTKLKYNIYDKYGITNEFVTNHEWRDKAYNSESEIKSDAGKFDVILLFNVLHEIGVDEWEKELNFIFSLLNDNGIVLFGERRILSIGERPYGKSGYLILGGDELEALFPNLNRESIILPEDVKEVTICYALKKKKGQNTLVTKENVKAAIQVLEKNTRYKIKEIQKTEIRKREIIKARNYAFYCQQYVNAQEALDILNKETFVSDFSNNMKLEDILQSTLSLREKTEQIMELAKENTEEGRKCKKYLEDRRRRN